MRTFTSSFGANKRQTVLKHLMFTIFFFFSFFLSLLHLSCVCVCVCARVCVCVPGCSNCSDLWGLGSGHTIEQWDSAGMYGYPDHSRWIYSQPLKHTSPPSQPGRFYYTCFKCYVVQQSIILILLFIQSCWVEGWRFNFLVAFCSFRVRWVHTK